MGYQDIALTDFTGAQVAGFWMKVKKLGPEECWPWQGSVRKGRYNARYGQLFVNSLNLLAHRVAYVLGTGKTIENGMTIDHVWEWGCRTNGLCCNPAHLEPCTQAENLDRYHRRQRLLNANCACGKPRRAGGVDRKCAECHAAYHKAYRQENPEKARKNSAESGRRWRSELRRFNKWCMVERVDYYSEERKKLWQEWRAKVLEREKDNPLYASVVR